MKRLSENSGSRRREEADDVAKSKPPPHLGGYEI